MPKSHTLQSMLDALHRTHIVARMFASVMLALALLSGCSEEKSPSSPPILPPDPVTVAPLLATPSNEFAAVWSPDGTQLAFCRGTDGVDLHVYRHDLATGIETQVSSLAGGRDCYPTWSPDGAEIAYDNYDDIFISTVDGDSTRRFTFVSGYRELFPAWSPPGEWEGWIAFSAQTTDLLTLQYDLFLQSVARDSVIRVTQTAFNDESEPDWSSDGSRIVFRAGQGTNTDILIVTLADSSFTRITDDSVLDANPTFSPDGRYVAWASQRSGNTEIWAIDLETPDAVPVQITSNAANDNAPDWSPDGETLLFSSDRQGSWDIFVATDLDSVLAASAGTGRRAQQSLPGSKQP